MESQRPEYQTPIAAAPVHPTNQILNRYVLNELGPRRRQSVIKHLEACRDCRDAVAELKGAARRWRDLERTALAQIGPRADWEM